MGGCYLSEKRILSRLQNDATRCLREFATLGDSPTSPGWASGSYCRIRMTVKGATKGADLDIGPSGFRIRAAEAASAKRGVVTYAPSLRSH